jgi:hypothetical protein
MTCRSRRGAIYLGERAIVTEQPQAELDEIARWRAAGAARLPA